MADVITRLKLDSGEYDSKIKRAVSGLQRMESEFRKAGNSLAVLEKDQLEYVKALGRMETVSRSARGKLSELKEAFTELSAQYNRLTEEEKNSPFGKALRGSLDQLKERINASKQELEGVKRELGETSDAGKNMGGALDSLTSKFGISVKSLAGWGLAISAGKVALDVAKDAFMSSETNIDEWGRTLEGAKGAYESFLDTLNTGNWSNFFDNLEKAINGGRDLYDALDRLGSVKSNNEAAIALAQAQVQELRVLKQQGKDVDKELAAAERRLKALRGQAVAAGKGAGETSAVNTIANYIGSMGGGVNNATIRAAVGGIMKNGQSEFDKYRNTVNQYENWSKAQGTTQRYNSLTRKYETVSYFDINLLTKEQQRRYKIAKAITEKETEIQKGISIYAQAVQEQAGISREEFRNNRYVLSGSGKNGGKNDVWAPIAMQDAGMVGMWSIADADAAIKRQKGKLANAGSWGERMDAQGMIAKLEKEKAAMTPNMNPFLDAFKYSFSKDLKALDKGRKEEDKKSDKTEAKMLEEAGKIASGMEAVTGGIEQLGIDLPNSIKAVTNGITSIISIISGIATILTAIQTVQMAQTFKFWSRGGVVHAAGGMVVPGNHYSGDLVPSMIQSGELILNKAQQGVLAAELEGTSNKPLRLETYVSGRDLKIVLNNDSEARGQGRFVTKVGG